MLFADGKIVAAGDYAQLQATLPPGTHIVDYRGKLIVPGFIDTHLHFPQTEMIASPAPGLLPWLEPYTFPTERAFEDPVHARNVAEFFLDELLRCGTTTAMVYGSVHPQSVNSFFEAAEQLDLTQPAASQGLTPDHIVFNDRRTDLIAVQGSLSDPSARIATLASAKPSVSTKGCCTGSRPNRMRSGVGSPGGTG